MHARRTRLLIGIVRAIYRQPFYVLTFGGACCKGSGLWSHWYTELVQVECNVIHVASSVLLVWVVELLSKTPATEELFIKASSYRKPLPRPVGKWQTHLYHVSNPVTT